MSGDRPAARFWAQAEEERRALAAEFAAKSRARMLTAAGVDPAVLSRQGRRILAWLADGDTPTIDGLVELLTAARAAGQATAVDDLAGDRRVDVVKARLAAREARHDEPGLGL